MYASALPKKSRSSKICVEINRKPERNIPNIIDHNLNSNQMTLIIFGENISDTTGYKINVLVSTSLNVCFCTTWGKQTKHNTCCNE